MFTCDGDALDQAREALSAVSPAATTAAMADQVRRLEELRGLLAATQATVTASFVAARKAEQAAAGVPAARVGLGVAHEVGVARRESPFRAARYAGWASILTRELPETLAALRAGATSEWRAMLLARETGWLDRADRATVDAQLGPRLAGLGDREVAAEARRLAYELDPRGLVARFARAAAGRRVGLRPEPDGMTRLTALLPLAQGVATWAALDTAASSAKAAGDERGRGQVMADTLVERVTGQQTAAAVPLTVNVVMTQDSLVTDGAGAHAAASVPGHGPIPAAVARQLISAETGAPLQLRRLLTDPLGRLVSMETTGRFFTKTQGEFVRIRDGHCRTPYCGAPIRHIDHIDPAARGGSTSLANAAGLCQACNQAKEAPGWQHTPKPDGTLHVITPTGQTSDPPPRPTTLIDLAFPSPKVELRVADGWHHAA